jgi:hypothetical protein
MLSRSCAGRAPLQWRVMNSSPFKWGGARVFAGRGVIGPNELRLLTPASVYDAATSPFEWGGKKIAPLEWRAPSA